MALLKLEALPELVQLTAVVKVQLGDLESDPHQKAVDAMEVAQEEAVMGVVVEEEVYCTKTKNNQDLWELQLVVKVWVRLGDQELAHHQKAVTMAKVVKWGEDHPVNVLQEAAAWVEGTLLELHQELHFLVL
jgi:hypothetical protein